MASRVTTVSHPDGTVSKRTSARATYTHAAVVKTDEREQAEHYRALAAAAEAEAQRQDAAALLGKVTEESRPWSRGATYHDVYVGGQWAGSYVTAGPEGGWDKERLTDDEYRAAVARSAESSRESAAQYRATADAKDAGPEFTYGVYRWSRNAALAAKGAAEVNWLKGRSTVTVERVDQTA